MHAVWGLGIDLFSLLSEAWNTKEILGFSKGNTKEFPGFSNIF